MNIDTIESALNALYQEFGTEEFGEDYALMESEGQRAITVRLAEHQAETNEARQKAGILTYPGLLYEAANKAVGESDPSLKIDALLEAAAVALAFAASVQRQTLAFDAVEDEQEEE